MEPNYCNFPPPRWLFKSSRLLWIIKNTLYKDFWEKGGKKWRLTALTVSSWETTEADALVGVQLGVALAAVVAGLLGTRVLLEGGYIAGAQDVVFLEDRGTHQDDLGAGETAGWSEIHHNWNCGIVSTSLCRHGFFKRCGYDTCLNKKKNFTN